MSDVYWVVVGGVVLCFFDSCSEWLWFDFGELICEFCWFFVSISCLFINWMLVLLKWLWLLSWLCCFFDGRNFILMWWSGLCWYLLWLWILNFMMLVVGGLLLLFRVFLLKVRGWCWWLIFVLGIVRFECEVNLMKFVLVGWVGCRWWVFVLRMLIWCFLCICMLIMLVVIFIMLMVGGVLCFLMCVICLLVRNLGFGWVSWWDYCWKGLVIILGIVLCCFLRLDLLIWLIFGMLLICLFVLFCCLDIYWGMLVFVLKVIGGGWLYLVICFI